MCGGQYGRDFAVLGTRNKRKRRLVETCGHWLPVGGRGIVIVTVTVNVIVIVIVFVRVIV